MDSTVAAVKGQVSSDLGEEVAILDLNAGVYYGLDAVGALVWDLIQKPRTVAEVRDAVVSEYDVESDRAGRDLLALLQDLADEGLIEVRDETPA